MLSYQHAYHAGNHADILKHYVLIFVLKYLNKKEKPYTFFDTHSGSGLYDLYDNRSLKTNEAENGILKLLKQNDFPSGLDDYCNFINEYVEKKMYPGSPEIEKQMMRKDDFLILSELHPQEIINLKNNISQNQNKDKNPSIQIHNRNGWEMINAITPPKTKRGGVLIDPSYEEEKDYFDAEKTIIQVYKKWSNGIILLWYPLLQHKSLEISNMLNNITEKIKDINPNTEICNLQLKINSVDSHKEVSLQELKTMDKEKNPPRLYGSGMFIINPPWKLKEEAENVIEYLEKVLSFFTC